MVTYHSRNHYGISWNVNVDFLKVLSPKDKVGTMCAVKATVWCVFASITLLRSQRCPTFKLKTLLYVILCHENC